MNAAWSSVPDWLYRGFSGHEQPAQFSLVNMNGRIYDPLIARMLWPDNYAPFAWCTQGYNRFGYAGNNRFTTVDQGGNLLFLIVAAALIGGYVAASIQQHCFNPGHWSSNWWKGAITGAVIGPSAAVGVGAIVSGSTYSATGVGGKFH